MSVIPLDSFLSSKLVPYTKFLTEKTFTTYNGERFQGYTYKGKKCLTIDTLLPHIKHVETERNPTYSTIIKAVKRSIKEYPMKTGVDYDKVTLEEFSSVKVRGKPSVMEQIKGEESKFYCRNHIPEYKLEDTNGGISQ